MDHEAELERLDALRAAGKVTTAQYDVRRAQIIGAASRRDLGGLWTVLALVGVVVGILLVLGLLLGG